MTPPLAGPGDGIAPPGPDESRLFQPFLDRLPSQLRNPEHRYVKIRRGAKKPFESDWPTKANYRYDNPRLLAHIADGGNYGVATGYGGLIIIDADLIDELAELGILSRLEKVKEKTWATSSGNPRGSFHLWIYCPEITAGSKRYHPTKQIVNDKGKEVPVLEIFSTGGQVVCPGSLHSRGTVYAPLNDNPIVRMSQEEVYALVDGLSQTQAGKRQKKGKKGKGGRKGRAASGGRGEEGEENVRHTTFLKLDDGRLCEQIGEDGRFKFAVYDGREVIELDELEYNGLIYKPLINEPILDEAVLFPSHAEEYGSLRELIQEIEAYLLKYCDASPMFLKIAARWAVMTYIYDRLETVVYLRLLSEYGSGKTRILLAIGKVCYKPIITMASTSPAALYRLIELVQGTLVLDEANFRHSTEDADVTRILNAGHTRGFNVMKCDVNDPDKIHSYRVFGPKILTSRKRFDDDALESKCITEITTKTERKDIGINFPPEWREETRKLRNKLLLYRFRNFHQVTGQEADSMKLETTDPRVRQSWSCLAPVVLGDEEETEFFKVAMILGEEELIAHNSTTWGGQIITAAKRLLDAKINPILISQIANEMEQSSGLKPVSSESVGRKLATMKAPKKRGNSGVELAWTEKDKQRLFDKYIPGYKAERLGWNLEKIRAKLGQPAAADQKSVGSVGCAGSREEGVPYWLRGV